MLRKFDWGNPALFPRTVTAMVVIMERRFEVPELRSAFRSPKKTTEQLDGWRERNRVRHNMKGKKSRMTLILPWGKYGFPDWVLWWRTHVALFSLHKAKDVIQYSVLVLAPLQSHFQLILGCKFGVQSFGQSAGVCLSYFLPSEANSAISFYRDPSECRDSWSGNRCHCLQSHHLRPFMIHRLRFMG
jgi:hypothetical protein